MPVNKRTTGLTARTDRKSTRLELQSRRDLVCRLLLEKKKKKMMIIAGIINQIKEIVTSLLGTCIYVSVTVMDKNYRTFSALLAAFFFYCYRVHRDLHTFPTRRSSD